MQVVEARNLQKRLARAGGAVADFCLDQFNVEAGEFVAVVGPSGSGKSTLLRLVAGLTNPDSGDIFVAQQSLAALSPAQRDRFRGQAIGIVFQDFNLLAPLTCMENLLLALRLADVVPRAAWIDRATTALATVGLADLARQMPTRLSAGERQRLAVARALINDPVLVLADEPMGNLDAPNAKVVFDLLRGSVIDGRRACVVVTHDLHAAARCDRTVEVDHWISRTRAAA